MEMNISRKMTTMHTVLKLLPIRLSIVYPRAICMGIKKKNTKIFKTCTKSQSNL